LDLDGDFDPNLDLLDPLDADLDADLTNVDLDEDLDRLFMFYF
jgi:hypothetical protein